MRPHHLHHVWRVPPHGGLRVHHRHVRARAPAAQPAAAPSEPAPAPLAAFAASAPGVVAPAGEAQLQRAPAARPTHLAAPTASPGPFLRR